WLCLPSRSFMRRMVEALPCSGGLPARECFGSIQRGGYVAIGSELVVQLGFFFGKQHRKDLQTADPECGRATKQIKSPHPPETFTIAVGKTRPGPLEVFFPCK